MVTAVKARCPEAKTDLRTKEWINEGYVKLGSIAKIPASVNAAISPATPIYVLPETLVSVDQIIYDNKSLAEIEVTDIDTSITADSPIYFYKRGNGIGLYPKPTAELTVTINFFKLPTPMVLDTEYPDIKIPYKYHGAIVNFAIARGKESDDDTTSARYYMEQFLRDMVNLEHDVNSDDGAGVFSIGVV